MKVLMFGWEFPPNITGGLGTACYGITKGLLSVEKNMDITFVVPRACEGVQNGNFRLRGANDIDLIKSRIHPEKFHLPVHYHAVDSGLLPYVDPLEYKKLTNYKIERLEQIRKKQQLSEIQFTGKYGPDLLTEVHNFSVIGEYLAKQENFNVIHAHDWLTYPAGIAAKNKTRKPLVIHVHATEFDRSRGQGNAVVYQIEKDGMEQADLILTVSNRTRETVINNYGIEPSKVITVYNGVEPLGKQVLMQKFRKNLPDKIVTFLGRITLQKGPEYFVKLADEVIKNTKSVRFVMAGSGEMLYDMIKMVAEKSISDRFHFAGFLKGNEVFKMFMLSDIYVMPSVSEPFGICPLEAMQCGTPTIISRQSGVSEVVSSAIKTDYWDIREMSDAVYNMLESPKFCKMLSKNGKKEVARITWNKSARKIYQAYSTVA